MKNKIIKMANIWPMDNKIMGLKIKIMIISKLENEVDHQKSINYHNLKMHHFLQAKKLN